MRGVYVGDEAHEDVYVPNDGPRDRRLLVVTVQRAQPQPVEHHQELSVDELLRRAQPLPAHQEMAIEGLTREEAEAFLAAVKS